MEHKSAAFELKAEPDSEGRFEGYASVFGNVDRGHDIVVSGAFKESLRARKPKMLWQHQPDKVIGAWESVEEDAKGLYVKGRVFTDLPLGKEAMTLLREGEIDSMSIGYRTIEAEEEGRARKLIKLDLWEVSLVTFPMNAEATVTGVKADATHDIREFERALRDVFALSQSEAKALVAGGYRALQAKRDVGPSEVETEALIGLHSQLTKLKEAINA